MKTLLTILVLLVTTGVYAQNNQVKVTFENTNTTNDYRTTYNKVKAKHIVKKDGILVIPKKHLSRLKEGWCIVI